MKIQDLNVMSTYKMLIYEHIKDVDIIYMFILELTFLATNNSNDMHPYGFLATFLIQSTVQIKSIGFHPYTSTPCYVPFQIQFLHYYHLEYTSSPYSIYLD